MQYISILRGINVGGKRKILMADLKKMYERMGFEEVQTYIQSGNVLFQYAENESLGDIEQKLEKQIEKTFGFHVPVIVKSRDEMARIILLNPFSNEQDFKEEKMYVVFLKQKPEQLTALDNIPQTEDQFIVKEDFIFLYFADKISNSVLTNNLFERKLKTSATTRNWKTVQQLIKLTENK